MIKNTAPAISAHNPMLSVGAMPNAQHSSAAYLQPYIAPPAFLPNDYLQACVPNDPHELLLRGNTNAPSYQPNPYGLSEI